MTRAFVAETVAPFRGGRRHAHGLGLQWPGAVAEHAGAPMLQAKRPNWAQAELTG